MAWDDVDRKGRSPPVHAPVTVPRDGHRRDNSGFQMWAPPPTSPSALVCRAVTLLALALHSPAQEAFDLEK